MVEYQLPKLGTRVRFPSLAPFIKKGCHAPRVACWQPLIRHLGVVVLLGIAAGCATTTSVPGSRVESSQRGSGVYHQVKKGQTLWRIAQAYHAPLKSIIAINKIPDAAHLEEGQLVFVPGASATADIPERSNDPDAEDFSWPVEGKVFHFFNEHRPRSLNKGIGIKVAPGEDVGASREGKVVFADYLPGYSNTVIVDHRDGFHSVYALNSRLLVKPGDHVAKGVPLAKVGGQGGLTYLYFEIRKDGQANNPLYYLPK